MVRRLACRFPIAVRHPFLPECSWRPEWACRCRDSHKSRRATLARRGGLSILACCPQTEPFFSLLNVKPLVSCALSYRSLFNILIVMDALKNRVHENSRCVHGLRRQGSQLDKLFDFGDHVIRGRGHHRIEISRRLTIDEVSPAIAFPRLDEREIAAQAALENEFATVKFANFFSFRDHSSDASRRIEGRNSRAGSA